MDELRDLLAKNAGAIAVVLVSALAGAVLTKFLPWLIGVAGKLGSSVTALLSGQWQDARFEREYLNWIVTHHGYLGLLPSKAAASLQMSGHRQVVDLEQIFVDLAITSTGGTVAPVSSSREIDGRDIGRRPSIGSSRSKVPATASQLGDAVQRFPLLVIRGDPGSGKTTLMKYLAVTCARAWRNDVRQGDRRALVYERLGWQNRPFPIMLSLGRLGNVANWDKERTLLDAFADELGPEFKCPPGFFKRRLERGHCLILLDAFDEIGSREGRTAMAHRVEGLVRAFPNSHNRIVVTTRIVGYEGQLDACGFTAQTVQSLSPQQMEALVRLRYRGIALNESIGESPERAKLIQQDQTRRAENLLAQLKRNARMRALATNPLLLSLIVLVHAANVELPEERHILYRDCVEILTQRWRQHKQDQETILSPQEAKDDLSLPQKVSLLQTLALMMQRQRTQSEEGQVPLRRSEAETLIAGQLPHLMSTQLPGDDAARLSVCLRKASEWLDGVKAESGILLEVGHDKTSGDPLITFSHLTFLEYLAAVAIRENPTLLNLISDNLLNQVWQEVVLLYMAMSPQAEATQLIQSALSAVTPQDQRGFLLAAYALGDKISLEKAVSHWQISRDEFAVQKVRGHHRASGPVCGRRLG